MAVRPPASWLSVVRALTAESDPSIQLGAARLIAPYDPELAASVLERLSGSDNPAIREEAARVFVQRVAGDFPELRRYLRSSDPLAAVRAAARIIELTR
jgi:HEAT repeat protein